jgi:hypothetical protein
MHTLAAVGLKHRAQRRSVCSSMTSIISMRVECVSPLLMHNPSGLRRTSATERGGKKIPEPLDEARAGLYVMPPHRLFVPADAPREAGLIAASDYPDPTRKGRTTMTRRFGASVFLSKYEFPLERVDGTPVTDDDDEWEMYVKRVVVQRAGILRSRPLVRDWAFEAEFEYDEDMIDPFLISTIVNQAGKYPGLLDYRPGKKGPFGRYKVVSVNGEPFTTGREMT